MPSGRNVAARIERRIKESAHSLKVVFPAVRTRPTGVTPGAAPASPLTGTATAPVVVLPEPTRLKDPVTISCLWMDAPQVGDLQANEIESMAGAWKQDADALARVIAADAVDGIGTIFDSCDYVEHGGRRYSVVSVVPMGPSFAAPHSYSVWLRGTTNQ